MDSVEEDPDNWEEMREVVLERDNRKCQFCGVSDDAHTQRYNKGLHVHHLNPRRNGGSDKKDNLLTVCLGCHKALESATKKAITNHLEAVLETVENMRKHARIDRHQAVDEGDTPPIRDGMIPWWHLQEMDSWSRAIYYLGRAEGLKLWAAEIEDVFPDSE